VGAGQCPCRQIEAFVARSGSDGAQVVEENPPEATMGGGQASLCGVRPLVGDDPEDETKTHTASQDPTPARIDRTQRRRG
jgi:hypothetical protein